MKVTVTAEHIAEGDRGSYHTCPIALAFSGQLGEVAWVGYLGAQTDDGRYFALPATATFFAQRFDEGKGVKPFTFEAEELEEPVHEEETG